ncbi:hypothetical protein Aperf_G00000067449 [Anoplocephala perfoliata]
MFVHQGDACIDIIKELDTVFSVHPSENLHLESTLNLFTTLRELTGRLGSKTPTSSLIKVYGDESFINYYKQCLDYFVLEPKLCGLVGSQSAQANSFSKLHSSLWHVCRLCCAMGYWVCEQLSKYCVHDSLWRFVSCRDLVATKCVQKSRTKLLVCWSFGILLHILTRTQVSVDSYRGCNGVHILRPFLVTCRLRKPRSQSEYLKMCALLLLIPIVNEIENKSINDADSYVVYLLSAVRAALKTQDFYSPLHKHHLRDMLCGLNRLARFDANKRILLENRILDDIQTILKIAKYLPNSKVNNVLKLPIPNTNSDNLATEAIRLLWQLCFLSETREQLSEYAPLLALCQEFGDSSRSKTCRETVQGLLWTLSKPLINFENSDIKYAPLSATRNPYGHIVFAYDRDKYRESVDRIMFSLKRRGYNVYLEPDQMEMEKALEDASALILCLSYSFSTSPYCRQQVLSALSYGVALVPVLLEKNYHGGKGGNAESWLHYLLATVIYTSFTENDNFERAMEDLSLALKKYGIVREVANAEIDSESDYLPNTVSPPSVSAAPPWRSVAIKGYNGRRVLVPFLQDSVDASTPTPSECPSGSTCTSFQFSPYSNSLRFRSWSGSASQISSSIRTSGSWQTPTEDQELLLAYQAPSPSIREWSTEHVQQWLAKSGLAHYSESLEWLDGRLLWELAWHRIRACDAFFCNLERSLNMPQQDQVLLFNSLSLLAESN